ncbi:MAG TPA: magnesium transporter CorA family protein [Candidatus Poseidoniaceae archaeon]|nr:magnesium transporter CorA family protein [Candidatus Poseidoniaceae archaeon]
MASIRVYTSVDASLGGKKVQLEELDEMIAELKQAWIDIRLINETEEETQEIRRFLLDKMKFHSLAVEDCFDIPVSRAERFENHRFVAFKARDQDKKLDTEYLRVFLTEFNVVTVRHSKIPAINQFKGRYRSARLEKQLKRGPEFLLYELLDAVADDWTEMLEDYSSILDTLEYQVFDPSKKYSDLLERLHVIKQDFREMSKSVVPLHKMVSQMLRPDSDFLSEDNLLFFQDTADNFSDIVTRVTNYSAGATSTRDSYLTHVSMRLSESNAQLTEVMTTLSIIGSIMLPLTLIAGIFGMNVSAFDAGTGNFDLWQILTLMGVFSVLMLVYFYSKGWLNKKN